jgi:hypothetical protein
MHQLTTSALKKGLQMANDLVASLFEVDNFTERSLKCKCKIKSVIALCKGGVSGHAEEDKAADDYLLLPYIFCPPPPHPAAAMHSFYVVRSP